MTVLRNNRTKFNCAGTFAKIREDLGSCPHSWVKNSLYPSRLFYKTSERGWDGATTTTYPLTGDELT